MFQITLAAARVNRNLKQEEAAKLIGVTPKTLRNYEKGVTHIPAHRLKKAAKVYSIPEDMLRIPVIDDQEYDDCNFFKLNYRLKLLWSFIKITSRG